ncbi:MAG: hypothetical protein GF416_09505 [Candidatus Altiarchaeales archaeon]|nr:hypothetical protein [Candidatus Altiarchaeales archaeon]MBD3417355.1 hypothetical protein [Candidatus Altiarchaeales archaeon]
MVGLKSLVVYYSRSGNTRKVAEEVANLLGAEIDEIEEDKSRGGPLGFIFSCLDGVLKKEARIRMPEANHSQYDLLVLGTPVWAGSMSTPMRSYLKLACKSLPRVAFFCTHGGSGASKAFLEMSKVCGSDPIATLALTEKELAQQRYGGKVKSYVEEIINS